MKTLKAHILVLLVICCNSCDYTMQIKPREEVYAAETFAAEYYESIKLKEYEKIYSNSDIRGSKVTDKAEWINALSIREELYGELISYKRVRPISERYQNGVISVNLIYECEYSKGIIIELIAMIDRGEIYKISYAATFYSEKELDDFLHKK